MSSISKICSVEDCNSPSIAKNLCGKHYQRQKNGLDLNAHYREYHGKTDSVEHNTWLSIKQRCGNPNYENYKYYGGKGIKVCDRWLHSFNNFFSDMGERPGLEYSIERIDSNKDYSPENCI